MLDDWLLLRLANEKPRGRHPRSLLKIVEGVAQCLTASAPEPSFWRCSPIRATLSASSGGSDERERAPCCPESWANVVDAERALCARPVYCSNACKQRADRKRRYGK
jgi:hypothetical protein